MLNSEIITSRNNTLVKFASSLADKKGRKDARSFMAEGLKLTLEAIGERLPITHILINQSEEKSILPRVNEALERAGLDQVEIYILGAGAFEKVSTEKAPQGVITIIKYLDFSINPDIIYKEEFFLEENERAIALCSVRDPLNLGAVIRSAVAFGVHHIVLSADCADVYSPKTLRSAMGGVFKTKVTVVSDMSLFVKMAQDAGRRVLAAELCDRAISLRDAELSSSDIVIIGNEGHGIPGELSARCDGSIYIPISGGIESLNASVAAAVFMWEQQSRS